MGPERQDRTNIGRWKIGKGGVTLAHRWGQKEKTAPTSADGRGVTMAHGWGQKHKTEPNIGGGKIGKGWGNFSA